MNELLKKIRKMFFVLLTGQKMCLFIFFSSKLLKTDNIILVIIAGQKAAPVHFLGGNWGPPLLSLAAQGMGKVSITNINKGKVINININISIKVLITITIMTILIIKLNPLSNRPDTKKKMAADLQSFLQVKINLFLLWFSWIVIAILMVLIGWSWLEGF